LLTVVAEDCEPFATRGEQAHAPILANLCITLLPLLYLSRRLAGSLVEYKPWFGPET
jgi:hypothetical protein